MKTLTLKVETRIELTAKDSEPLPTLQELEYLATCIKAATQRVLASVPYDNAGPKAAGRVSETLITDVNRRDIGQLEWAE